MYYRYEAREPNGEWIGIFQHMSPDQRRKWYCLHIPKYLKEHPDCNSQSWFTEHGYQKWHTKMEETIEAEFQDLEVRIVIKEMLENVVMKGKTQCIVR